jgi:hypothetical protein
VIPDAADEITVFITIVGGSVIVTFKAAAPFKKNELIKTIKVPVTS